MKSKHSITVEDRLWELAKANDANTSELLEEMIKFKFGVLAKFQENLLFCKRCDNQIPMSKLKSYGARITDDENGKEIKEKKNRPLLHVTMCSDCWKDIGPQSRLELGDNILPREWIHAIIKELGNNPMALKQMNIFPGYFGIPNFPEFLSVVRRISVLEAEEAIKAEENR